MIKVAAAFAVVIGASALSASAGATATQARPQPASSPSSSPTLAASADGPAVASPVPAARASVGARSPTTVTADTRFCRAASANAQVVLGGAAPELVAAAAGGKDGSARLKAFIVKAQLANTALLAAAPPGLRKSMSLVVQQADALSVALEKVGYDVTKFDPATRPKVSAADAAASKTVTAYLTTVCRIDPAKLLTK